MRTMIVETVHLLSSIYRKYEYNQIELADAGERLVSSFLSSSPAAPDNLFNHKSDFGGFNLIFLH